jgi:predicted nucleic acid-binding protein
VAAYFVDSSALVKRFVQEDGTRWVRNLTRRSEFTNIYVIRITAVEVTSAVARRRAGNSLTRSQATSILYRLRRHLAARYAVAEVTPALAEAAMKLANRHTLRAYDAVQLAAASKRTVSIVRAARATSPWCPPMAISTRPPSPKG